MFTINQADADATTNVVESTLYICNRPSKVFIDLGSTHSYIAPSFSSSINVQHANLPHSLTVTTSVGKQVICHSFYQSCRVKMGEFILLVNLIILPMNDFDVILGWIGLHSHGLF